MCKHVVANIVMQSSSWWTLIHHFSEVVFVSIFRTMDAFHISESNVSNASLTAFLNIIALKFFVGFHCTCIITSDNEFPHQHVDIPSIIIALDQNFENNFRNGIDIGCQAFIVYGKSVMPFLDSFLPVHDSADQRFSGKKLIAVIDSGDFDTFEYLFAHEATKDIPDILIILQSQNHPMELYTTHIYSNGSRGSKIVEPLKISSSDYFPEKSKNLNGTPMRYRAINYLPFTYYSETTPEQANARYDRDYSEEDIPVQLDGHESLILVEFCQRHNCSIEAYPDDWGNAEENGTSTGAIGAVAKRHADFLVGALYYWIEPYNLLTYTAQLSRSGVTVVVPRPQTLPPWRTPFLSFSVQLWIAVMVAFAVGAVSVWFVEKNRLKLVPPGSEQPKSFSDSVLTIIGFFMEQNASIRNDLAACVFLYTSLLFAGFMISNLYGAGLSSVMTIPQYEGSIDTPEDLAASGMLWGADSLVWINSLIAGTEPYQQTLVKNYRVMELEQLVQRAKTRDFGFVGERTEFGHFGPTDFLDKETSRQKKLLANDILWQSCTAFVSKTCPFKPRLNDLIMNIRQSGIQYYWELRAVNQYLDVHLQQNVLIARKSGAGDEIEALTVSHFLGAFLILSSGCFVGLIVYILELFVCRFTVNGRRQNLGSARSNKH